MNRRLRARWLRCRRDTWYALQGFWRAIKFRVRYPHLYALSSYITVFVWLHRELGPDSAHAFARRWAWGYATLISACPQYRPPHLLAP